MTFSYSDLSKRLVNSQTAIISLGDTRHMVVTIAGGRLVVMADNESPQVLRPEESVEADNNHFAIVH